MKQRELSARVVSTCHFDIRHQIANGGDTRFQSSKNGLALIPDDEDGYWINPTYIGKLDTINPCKLDHNSYKLFHNNVLFS